MATVKRVALIGCGLMGGSFALALKAAAASSAAALQPAGHGAAAAVPAALADTVTEPITIAAAVPAAVAATVTSPITIAAYSRSRASAERAVALGVADTVCASAAEAARGADLVLLAVPVTATEATLRDLRAALSAEALVMDVGSTKRDVVAAARAALGPAVAQFVPAHPIAGKEAGGIEQAEAGLYRDRRCIITPLPENPAPLLARAQALWEAVGCSVVQMSAEQHDQTFAAVSHLPHLLAFAYVNGVATQLQAARHLALAGPGFRDFSRIAAGTSAIWRDIFSANRDEVLDQLSHFEAALAELRAALQANDAPTIARLVDAASAVRAGWTLNGAPVPPDDPA